jgi:branched-chain amino acid transport system permease protein
MIFVTILITSVLVGGVYALFAVGLSLLAGTMRVFNVAHGAVATAAALVAIKLAADYGWGIAPLVLVGAAVGAGLAIPLEFLCIRPFRKAGLLREDMEHGTLLATLALFFVMSTVMTDLTKGNVSLFPYGTYPTNVVRVGNISVGVMYFVNFAAAVLLMGLLTAALRFTQVGRAVRALTSDHRAAQLLGINVARYSLGSAVAACSLAGTAGVLLATFFNSVTFQFGDQFLHQGFVIIVIGGMGSVPGAAIGALMLALIEGFVAYYKGGSWAEAVAFSVLIVFLLLRPQGIFGRAEVARA